MSAIKFLITGATSGLGGSVLATLYEHVSAGSKACIAAASSRADAADSLQNDYPGIQFRHLDFGNREQMVKSLHGVERLFFVSSPEIESVKREKQHANVVKAAREAGVHYVYYASLAFGGYGSHSNVGVQQAHLVTERLLQQEELGEATANLMLRDPGTLSFHNNIALLTASRTYTLADVVAAISQATGTDIPVEQVSRDDFPRILAAEDAKDGRGKKSEQFFTSWRSLIEAMEQGEARTVDPLMQELLGREPRDAMQHVARLVQDGAREGGYTWHQNYAKR
ncbi:predicted protein [Uncinocarpus reesii 1704]|uniref:Uncharacterized protein n=1 Tax=Uncinocarpus reesii (strain UAMH 1704) TaxID=336963 RepID=C4JUB0_UNCRE|nr:uncharacterized protein UREG_06049 [Uncinocarpus reesii 1704]EEP81207.1 predicted protein [Uncinocarpus reesii 1704]